MRMAHAAPSPLASDVARDRRRAGRTCARPAPPAPPRARRTSRPHWASPSRPTTSTTPALYINRELSWLEFNRRVLAQASDPSHPLLERVKFLAISATNLDEFFMVRVATLLKKFRAGIDDTSIDGLSTDEELEVIRARAGEQMTEQTRCWIEQLRPQLAGEGIHFLEPADYTPAIDAWLTAYFEAQVFPVLTPLAFDPGHPFPFISNLSMNLAVRVRHGGRIKFARVKVPDMLPRLVPLPAGLAPFAGTTFVFLEDVIRRNIRALFPGTQVEGAHLFRVIRDTDMVIQEDEADDLLETVDRGLKQLRYGALSLLQVEADMPRRVLDILIDNFEVDHDVVVRTSARMGLGDWSEIYRAAPARAERPGASIRARCGDPTKPTSVFEQIADQDFLVHHPFDSFTSVETFLKAAIADAQVVAIKITLYRIGADSPLVDLLIQAAEQGKQVAVLVELKARFDERNNIAWATRLESAGIHVVYGLVNLKVHCKLCLVVRKELGGIRRYAHVATGNYNRVTSRIYTDLGLFTADDAIVDDVSEVFNTLTGYSNKRSYRALLVAPVGSAARHPRAHRARGRACRGGPSGRHRNQEQRGGRPGDDQAALSGLAGGRVDRSHRARRMLPPAGRAGVQRPPSGSGRSSAGCSSTRGSTAFENGGQPELYIGSADLMERNLDRRIEVLAPITDVDLRTHLREVVLGTLLKDTARSWVLSPTGRYERAVPALDPIDAQKALIEWHASHARDDA